MLLTLPDVLPAALLAQVRAALAGACWHDGRETAGGHAAARKHNRQLRTDDPLAIELGRHILGALGQMPGFVSATLPLRILPPMFNRYGVGETYGYHVDNAIRVSPEDGQTLRTDVSATLFLADPADYDGGELIVRDTFGTHRVKLPAGHLVVYPASSVHQVAPVTRGERIAAFFWIQSMVRDDARRTLLYELDGTIQRLGSLPGADDEVTRLTGIYHNLVRQWAQL